MKFEPVGTLRTYKREPVGRLLTYQGKQFFICPRTYQLKFPLLSQIGTPHDITNMVTIPKRYYTVVSQCHRLASALILSRAFFKFVWIYVVFECLNFFNPFQESPSVLGTFGI